MPENNQPPPDEPSYLPPSYHPKLFVDVPPDPTPYAQPHTNPASLDPIQAIRAEGAAYRSMSHGKAPWVMIIGGWATLGLPALFICGFALATLIELVRESGTAPTENEPSIWLAVLPTVTAALLSGVFIVIMLKGTYRKIKDPRSKR